MKQIPRRIKINNKSLNLIKVYKSFALYEYETSKIKECFSFYDLGMLPKAKKVRNLSPEKVRR